MVEAKRRTDGQHPLADFEFLGVSQFDRRQVLAFNLEQGHVSARVGAHQLGLQLAAIRQAHDDFIGVGHHVVVG
ncbi:hypothetical protein D3C80_1465990 [compost metagenome]